MISCSKPKTQAVYTQPRADEGDDGDVSTTHLLSCVNYIKQLNGIPHWNSVCSSSH